METSMEVLKSGSKKSYVPESLIALGVATAVLLPIINFNHSHPGKIAEREKLKQTISTLESYAVYEGKLNSVITDKDTSKYFQSTPIMLYNNDSLITAKSNLTQRVFQINEEVSRDMKNGILGLSIPGYLLAIAGLVGFVKNNIKRSL